MRAELLNVVTVRFNPIRFQAPERNFERFERHMLESGVCLHVVELQVGDRPFVATPSTLDWPAGRYSMTQLRSRHEMFVKENLINIGVSRLPADWKYVAWVDADIHFRRPEWAAETVHKLQTFDVVQPWSHCEMQGPNGAHEHVDIQKGFVARYIEMLQDELAGKKPYGTPHGKHPYGGWWGHCGMAWAMRRSAWDKLGGLIDTAILGSADHHMACALVGAVRSSSPDVTPAFLADLKRWEARAEQHIQRNIGFVRGTIDHHFHRSEEHTSELQSQ